MAKGKIKPVYQADGWEFDSREEMDFYYWLCEARESGMIAGWCYHPRTLELAKKVTYPEEVNLKTKTKTVERHLLNPCVYTPDFTLMLNAPRAFLLRKFFYGGPLIWVDVKGVFSLHNDDVKFSLIQKWMFQKYKIYVHKIMPRKFFEETFVPRRCAYGKNGALRVCYTACRTRSKFIRDNAPLI